MKIHFCSSPTVGGLFIRLVTFSKYNHVAIEIDGKVWDSTLRYGVATWKAEEWKGMWDNITTFEITGLNEEAAKSFLNQQIGKHYDWIALFALPFRKDWQHRAKWFCSELVIEALRIAGFKFFKLPSFRVTPRDVLIMVGTFLSNNNNKT